MKNAAFRQFEQNAYVAKQRKEYWNKRKEEANMTFGQKMSRMLKASMKGEQQDVQGN